MSILTGHTARDPHTAGSGDVLNVTDLRVSFPSEAGTVQAVRGIDLALRAGQTHALVGESGSGKSVTATAILGLLPPSATVQGSVSLNGRELLGLTDTQMSRIRGNDIGMVFQDPLSALTPVFSIGQQITEAIQVHQGLGKTAARARALELLNLVGIPDPRRRIDGFPHEFSGGMRQRVVIAMAIANDPQVIIADEPTTALDVTIQAQVLDLLQKAQEFTGAAILMITHDLGVVAGLADQVTVMYAGKAVESGACEALFAKPRMPYTIGLLSAVPRLDSAPRAPLTPMEGNPPSAVDVPRGCPFAARCPVVLDRCLVEEPPMTAATDGSGQSSACHRSAEIGTRVAREGMFPTPATVAPADLPERSLRTPVLQVTGLTKHFPLTKGQLVKRRVGTVRAVDGITFDIREGETFALVGESGCGKTTTLLEILGLPRKQHGSVVVLGRHAGAVSGRERRALRRDLQIVFQDPMASLDSRMPVGDILAEPMRAQRWSKDRIHERVPELLRLVRLLPEHAERYPVEFSGGQRQRIGIARALALDPKLIVLDEPVSALDVSIQAGVVNLLNDLKAQLGLSYLFVAHDLSVIRHVADRVAVMYLGRIVESGDADQVFGSPSHPYTQALLSAVPLPDPVKERERQRVLLTGDLPSPADVPSGCRFRSRCPKFPQLDDARAQRCRDEDPSALSLTGDHNAACHFAAPADSPADA
ncbi:ABC transporter ATP-binding protein [Actinacidiphila bryophytorum]|uniref:ABC transporter ATP-binding protein n=1 Tax=Actinacidiphila bryophytorum TaxID=1436133 RepID=UPI002176F058|nr:ABC transporter ATP-binding protein [Actinacidiphila bryophytorum]UWE08365.1 ABC transporter ATP-binding protein [Actinacidiphila bryophytorum]